MAGQMRHRGNAGPVWRSTTAAVIVALGASMTGPTMAQDGEGESVPSAQDPGRSAQHGAVSVNGTSTLVGQLDGGVSVVEDGVVRTRDTVLVTEERSSDARVSGRATIDLDTVAYPGVEGAPLGGQVRYGTMRLENDAGAWEGSFTGRLSNGIFLQTYWLAGEGDYAGWSYVVTAGGNGNVWFSDGLIYPGVLPPSDGVARLPATGPDRDRPSA